MNDRYIDGGASLIQLYGWLRETGEIDRLIDLLLGTDGNQGWADVLLAHDAALRAENERLRKANERLRKAIDDAFAVANGRWCEWGARAEAVEEILCNASSLPAPEVSR